MIRRLPPLATLLVLLAVAIMVRLGIWQIHRLQWKEGLISRYEAAMTDRQSVVKNIAFGLDGRNAYHRVDVFCMHPLLSTVRPIAGRNVAGDVGWAYLLRCTNKGDVRLEFDVITGWSRNLQSLNWSGGEVKGTIVPGGDLKYHIVSDPPLAGLQPNARPNPSDLPNNHFSYAVQWFLFAATALVIYAIAVRKHLKD
jgi:surfeit locus 1 family protein